MLDESGEVACGIEVPVNDQTALVTVEHSINTHPTTQNDTKPRTAENSLARASDLR